MKMRRPILVLALATLLMAACQIPAAPKAPVPPAPAPSTTPAVDRLATAMPVCDLVCQDATATARLTLTPLPSLTVTNSPQYYTQEAQYHARLTLEAGHTKSPTPGPAHTPTLLPTDQPGFAVYQGQSYIAETEPPPLYRLLYAMGLWRLEDSADWQYSGIGPSDLRRREIEGCILHLATLPRDVLEPVTRDHISLADYTWKRTFAEREHKVFYSLSLGRDWYGFELDLPPSAPATNVQQCQSEAETVIDTFTLVAK